MIQEYEMFYKDDDGRKVKDITKFNVLITTFETVITDCVELSQVSFRICVIDEAHRLKNKDCKLIEGLRLLNLVSFLLLKQKHDLQVLCVRARVLIKFY